VFSTTSAGSVYENVKRCENLSVFYKGRISFLELYNMDPGMFQILYSIAYERMQSGDAEKEIQADAIEEAMEEGKV
jgi:predicted DNA-binding protein YlxM (UPF0122 family)